MSPSTTRTNTSKIPTFHTLTRGELTTFDREAKDLILQAMRLGCTGRVSSKGHCILRNNAGDTASIPRNLTSPNRTAQNARASMRKFLASHLDDAPVPVAGEKVVRASQQITVARAFVEHGNAFSRWFDDPERTVDAPHGLGPENLLQVTFDELDRPWFDLVDRPVPAPDVRSDGEGESADASDTEFVCSSCDGKYPTPAALGSHRRVHRGDQPSISQIARVNNTARDSVRERLRRVGAVKPDGDFDITPENLQRARLTMPKSADSPIAAPTVPGSTDEPEPADAALTLQRVRAALGQDPRIAQLEARNNELEEELTQQKRLVDEAQARLTLIQEAFHA